MIENRNDGDGNSNSGLIKILTAMWLFGDDDKD